MSGDRRLDSELDGSKTMGFNFDEVSIEGGLSFVTTVSSS